MVPPSVKVRGRAILTCLNIEVLRMVLHSTCRAATRDHLWIDCVISASGAKHSGEQLGRRLSMVVVQVAHPFANLASRPNFISAPSKQFVDVFFLAGSSRRRFDSIS